MAKRIVKVMFPGFTHGGKIYAGGEVEENPDDFLMDFAKSGEKRYHRDSGRKIRIAKFVKRSVIDNDNDDDDGGKIKRTPVILEDDDEPEDGLREKTKTEMAILAAGLGFKKDSARKLERDQLISLIRFLRKI